MISIIMASYLGAYKGAASDRENKLRRAINSVLLQKIHEWELIVIADGCDRTCEIVAEYPDERVQCYKIPKQKIWSGIVRNTGVNIAKGDYIVYLDNDDVLGPSHLQMIADGIAAHPDFDWYLFNDMIPHESKFIERACNLQRHKCGTSNIAHKRTLAQWAPDDTYDHDWHFIQQLMKRGRYVRITGQYLVCHVPNKWDL